MYNPKIHQLINASLQEKQVDIAGKDNLFFTRFVANTASIYFLYGELYKSHPKSAEMFKRLIDTITDAYQKRTAALKQLDDEKEIQGNWFLSNEIAGMSLYVDRFCGSLANMEEKLDYFKKLGVNFLHLMPVMQSPDGESDVSTSQGNAGLFGHHRVHHEDLVGRYVGVLAIEECLRRRIVGDGRHEEWCSGICGSASGRQRPPGRHHRSIGTARSRAHV